MTTNNAVLDPWAVAMEEQLDEFYGDICLDVRFVMLVKGAGKMPYDPQTLNPESGEPYRRSTEVAMSVKPFNRQWAIDRNPIIESEEWQKITMPSLKACGVMDLKALNNRFVRVALVPTGRTYTNRQGETRNVTALKFLAVYADEAACRVAWQAAQNCSAEPAAAPAAPAQPTNGNGNGNERATAAQFLKVYMENAWRGAGGDLDKFNGELAGKIAGQAILAKFFTVEAPEVVDFLTGKLASAAA